MRFTDPINVDVSPNAIRNATNDAIVYYHLNKLINSQFDKPHQEIVEVSRSAAAAATAAAAAAKAARANANAKAYAAARAVAAAKNALSLIALFPNREEVRKDKLVAVAEAEAEVDEEGDTVLKDQEFPSGDAGDGVIMPISSPSGERKKNEEWSAGRLRERPSAEHDAVSNKKSAAEVGSPSRVVESSVGGQVGAKEDVQKPTRKRGRPRKH